MIKEWKTLELATGTKRVSDSRRRGVGKRVVMFTRAMATTLYNGMGVHLKKIASNPQSNHMSSQSCCQKAYIRCHHYRSAKKKKSTDGIMLLLAM
jgi:hypothetical protein